MSPRTEALSRFMKARHNIYLKRIGGWPGPWTDDPVLRDGRFCNIFRELDTVTIWVRENIREPYADHPNLWLMLCIARYINWPPTLAALIESKAWPSHPEFTPEYLTTALEGLAAMGHKVYTGAYMIRAESDPNKPWYVWTKHRYIAEIVIGRLWEYRDQFECRLESPATLEDVWDLFQEPYFIGWGPFMAYEVVTDLRHTRYLRDAPDIMTWANAGPGAIRGLNRLYGRELNTQPKKEQTNNEMFLLMEQMNANPMLWPEKWPRLEMRDVEHSLCEFDKYERVQAGDGKMRSKYDWRKATDLTRNGE